MNNQDFKSSNIDVLTAIRARRSIRKYTSDPVSDQTLNTILHAGLCAPTARNRRPFHFMVIKERERLDKLAKGKNYARMLQDAPVAILICGDKTVESRPEHLYADCFAATQNMLLAIHGLDLGGVWLGVSVNTKWHELIKELLKLPTHIEPTAVIALGHPAEEKPEPDTWEQDKIHYETWSL